MVQRLVLAGVVAMAVSLAHATDDDKKIPKTLDFKMKSLKGEEVDLSKYHGKVILVVNVASKCGLTPQYQGLQSLYEKYADKGFVVLGFPCNQFGGQEPGSSEEIASFCQSKYDVTFDMFEKIRVNEDGTGKPCDFYAYLTSVDAAPVGKGKISWNFEKFLIDREGNVIARFSPRTTPDAKELVTAIEEALNK